MRVGKLMLSFLQAKPNSFRAIKNDYTQINRFLANHKRYVQTYCDKSLKNPKDHISKILVELVKNKDVEGIIKYLSSYKQSQIPSKDVSNNHLACIVSDICTGERCVDIDFGCDLFDALKGTYPQMSKEGYISLIKATVRSRHLSLLATLVERMNSQTIYYEYSDLKPIMKNLIFTCRMEDTIILLHGMKKLEGETLLLCIEPLLLSGNQAECSILVNKFLKAKPTISEVSAVCNALLWVQARLAFVNRKVNRSVMSSICASLNEYSEGLNNHDGDLEMLWEQLELLDTTSPESRSDFTGSRRLFYCKTHLESKYYCRFPFVLYDISEQPMEICDFSDEISRNQLNRILFSDMLFPDQRSKEKRRIVDRKVKSNLDLSDFHAFVKLLADEIVKKGISIDFRQLDKNDDLDSDNNSEDTEEDDDSDFYTEDDGINDDDDETDEELAAVENVSTFSQNDEFKAMDDFDDDLNLSYSMQELRDQILNIGSSKLGPSDIICDFTNELKSFKKYKKE